MQIAFLDSWLQNAAEGSGTAAGIGGLQQALIARDHAVDRRTPTGPRPRNLTLCRLWFNLQLPVRLARLRALAAELRLNDAAQFLGAIPSDDVVAQLYQQADIFCLPSVQEGFGIVFLEAMASGLPIVATNATAIPEVVPHGQAGLLVAPGNVAALARALIELLRNPEQRATFGAFGQAHVEQFNWSRVTELFIAQVKPFVQRAAAGMCAETV